MLDGADGVRGQAQRTSWLSASLSSVVSCRLAGSAAASFFGMADIVASLHALAVMAQRRAMIDLFMKSGAGALRRPQRAGFLRRRADRVKRHLAAGTARSGARRPMRMRKLGAGTRTLENLPCPFASWPARRTLRWPLSLSTRSSRPAARFEASRFRRPILPRQPDRRRARRGGGAGPYEHQPADSPYARAMPSMSGPARRPMTGRPGAEQLRKRTLSVRGRRLRRDDHRRPIWSTGASSRA